MKSEKQLESITLSILLFAMVGVGIYLYILYTDIQLLYSEYFSRYQ